MAEKRIPFCTILNCVFTSFLCLSSVTGFPFFHSRQQQQEQQIHHGKINRNRNNQYCIEHTTSGISTTRINTRRKRRLGRTIIFQANANGDKKGSQKKEKDGNKNKRSQSMRTYSARLIDDNGLVIVEDEEGRITAQPAASSATIEAPEDEQEQQEQNTPSSEATEPSSSPLTSSSGAASTLLPAPTSSSSSSPPPAEAVLASALTPETATGEQQQKKKKRKLNFKIRPKHKVTTMSSDGTTTTTTTSADKQGRLRLRSKSAVLNEQSPKAKVVPTTGFNVVLTHCTADFDSLASAVGLAKLWSHDHHKTTNGFDKAIDDFFGMENNRERDQKNDRDSDEQFDSSSLDVPTYVVLPRGAHPDVQRFLALHKYLFPIQSLRSLPNDLSGLHRLGLVDAQRRDRIGPAEKLIEYADRITVVDHHVDMESDIPDITDYVVDKVGSVSTLIAERLKDAEIELTEAEATLLALGIHCDTGSLCYDSTTPRDAMALAWVMSQGASQTAIAEHAKSTLSSEQQNVLTQTLVNTNVTCIHGVSIGTVLLRADGFINGLAAVTQDALELSSSDIFLLSLVYEATSGGNRKSKKKGNGQQHVVGARVLSTSESQEQVATNPDTFAEACIGGREAVRRQKLQTAFDRIDTDSSGYIDRHRMAAALGYSGLISSQHSVEDLMKRVATSGRNSSSSSEKRSSRNVTTITANASDAEELSSSNKVSFDDFVAFSDSIEKVQQQIETSKNKKSWTMIIIGRVKAGVNMKSVKLNKLLEKNFGGGGHAKAASATIRLNHEYEAEDILQNLVDELIDTYLQRQSTVGDFMTAPVLSAKPNMNERQVEDLFTRYDVRALPVVDDNNDVIGLVTYKEVAAAKQRLWNKEQKRLKRELQLQKQQQQEQEQNDPKRKGKKKQDAEGTGKGGPTAKDIAAAVAAGSTLHDQRARTGTAVKGWMKQHVQTVEASKTMAEVEAILLETDVGCIPVVADGTNQLVGMVTRTDLLRQHRYYASLHYNNKGFSNSIAARKPIVELRKRLKKFDLDNE